VRRTDPQPEQWVESVVVYLQQQRYLRLHIVVLDTAVRPARSFAVHENAYLVYVHQPAQSHGPSSLAAFAVERIRTPFALLIEEPLELENFDLVTLMEVRLVLPCARVVI
jgi:hypothetical protein